MKLLVTAGPTREALDPVRFLTNRSSGKMGYAIAAAGIEYGLDVTLISGPVSLTPPEGLTSFVPVISAREMADAVRTHFPLTDVLIMCAAVADYRPAEYSASKIKKHDGDLILRLERTEDILKTAGQCKKENQILAGFAAETDDLHTNALKKLREKNLDWIIANDVSKNGCGFSVDTNAVTVFARDGRIFHLPLASKHEIARHILELILPPDFN